MKTLMLLPEGFSEIEVFTLWSAMKKAGIDITAVSLSSSIVSGSEKIKAMSDKKISEIDHNAYDLLILPGGPGHKVLLHSSSVRSIAKSFNNRNKIIAASGESSVVLAQLGIIDDKVATVFPGYEKYIPKPREAKIVVAKNVITSRGPATAIDLAIKLVEIGAGKSAAAKVRRSMGVDTNA